MGCVFGRIAGGDRREGHFSISKRRRADEATYGGVSEASFNAISARKEAAAAKAVAGRGRRASEGYRSDASPVDDIMRWRQSPGAQNDWPPWLISVAGEAIGDWKPRVLSSFKKLDKIGQGTYSHVYKAMDSETGKLVALKKVRLENFEPESVKFMVREILILRRLDHPNVLKLEGLATSRLSPSLYLIFEYMEHDLAGLAARKDTKFSEPQIKCYMKQLLSGLEHCHINGILHRDIKGSNLLIDDNGILKIADFGLATFYDPERQVPMTTRVVTLWYRAPELLLGAPYYGVGVDLWSAGCILAELLSGKPILPGRTEVEQLHKIFKLCGSPTDDYWGKFKLPNSTVFKPQQPYKRCIDEAFKDFPPYSLPLVETLLSIEPDGRGTASAALNSEFFINQPFACEPSSLPKYPPSKEMDVKLREEELRRKKATCGKGGSTDEVRRTRPRDRISRAVPAPEANAELPSSLDRWRVTTQATPKSKSEKFPPPHQDAAVGYHMETFFQEPVSFNVSNNSFSSMVNDSKTSLRTSSTGDFNAPGIGRTKKEDGPIGTSQKLKRNLNPSSGRLPIDSLVRGKSGNYSSHR